MSATQDLYNRISHSFNKQNFLTLIGAELEHVEAGKVVISCKHKDVLTQQHGLLHGGVIASLADVACGYAALTSMPEDCEVLSVEFKINIVRPASSSKLIASGQVIKTGRTLVVAEASVTDENGDIIAKMLATMIAAKTKN